MANLKDKKIRLNQSTEYNTALSTYESGHIYFTNNNNDINNNAIILEGKIYGAAPLIEIQYNQLKELVTNKKLIPGTNYKIIDYVTTTSQAETVSAGHQFDIIVTAISENQLSENARACKHKDDNYFSYSNLSAWELKYCLDNDTSRFTWAIENKTIVTENYRIKPELINGNTFIEPFTFDGQILIDTAEFVYEDGRNDIIYEWGYETEPNGEDSLYIIKNGIDYENEGMDYSDKHYYRGTIDIEGEVYDKWEKYEGNTDEYYTSDAGGVYFLTKSIVEEGSSEITINKGKGVIYYMKDEFNNECPYDFKNIKFYNQEKYNRYLFTFSWINENDEIEDLTLRQDLSADDELAYGTYGNIIKPYYDEYVTGPIQILNNIIFVNSYSYNWGLFYGCYNNIFGNDCHNNSFGNECLNNSFGDNCCRNIFNDSCYNNSFGIECDSNSFGNTCNYNSFGNYCISNSFGNMCYSNSFGNECLNNSFGNYCISNSFGNTCNYNSFGNGCSNNSFGNDCDNNSFGNTCNYNSFGNGCSNNSLGNRCTRNSLGNHCYNNSFKDYCINNSLGNVCGNNGFGNECTHNRLGNECVGNKFKIYCCSNSFGNDCDNNSFGDYCNNNSFDNDCVNNSFGDYCNNNSFDNDCDNNSFGDNCDGNVFNNGCLFNNLGNKCDYNTFGNDCKYNGFYDGHDYTYDEKKNYYVCNDVLLDNVRYIKLGNGCSNLIIWNDLPNPTIQNINICQGVKGIDIDENNAIIPESIYISDLSPNYETKVAKNTKGDIKIYCEADLIY